MISYETYALVRDVVTAQALPPITMKGISREVVPYAVDNMLDTSVEKSDVVIERMGGLDFYLDASSLDAQGIDQIRACWAMRWSGWTAASPSRLNRPAQ